MPLGTAGYIDPDVVDGSEPSVRSDVYSLGVVCYEALSGRRPFQGVTELAVMKAADRGEYVSLRGAVPGISPALADVVERAMARDPGRRFGDAAEFARVLRGARERRVPRCGDDSRPDTPSVVTRTEAPPQRTAAPSSDVAPTGLFGPRPPEPPALRRRRF